MTSSSMRDSTTLLQFCEIRHSCRFGFMSSARQYAIFALYLLDGRSFIHHIEKRDASSVPGCHFSQVLFEILSAYGTCGLSLGFESGPSIINIATKEVSKAFCIFSPNPNPCSFRNQTFSFSGVWCWALKS